jgi:hypothetical protein
MSSSIFEQVTSSITVKSICSPMGPDIPSMTPLDDVKMTPLDDLNGISLNDLYNNPARIIDSEGNLIGVAWFEDYYDEAPWDENGPYFIDDVKRELEPNCLLSSSTTIFDAVVLFTENDRRYFYVIDVNKIVGVLFYEDLFRPIGRIAFLSLALEIEDLALRLCKSSRFRESCWSSISENRKHLSLGFFQQRYSRKPQLSKEVREAIPSLEIRDLTEEIKEGTKWWAGPGQSDINRLIACTQLKDKATMIWKNKLITGRSKTDLLGFFDELKDVRDTCAHPGHDDSILSQDRLAEFVSSAMRMRKSLQEAIRSAEEALDEIQISNQR